MQSKSKKNLVALIVSALFIALSTVLSELIPSISLPFGGSITVLSMVPVCLIGIIFGTKWGLISCTAYGVIQLMFGLGNLAYATGFAAVVAIILFDYVVAYAVLGLTGVFKGVIKNKIVACVLGVVLACLLRYLCHFITGVTVWREIADLWEAIWFSITYNGTYMIPEIITTPIGVAVIVKTGIIEKAIGKIVSQSI